MTMDLSVFKNYVYGAGRNVARGTAIQLGKTSDGAVNFNSNSGDKRWIIHSQSNKENNNEIRNQFLDALTHAVGLKVEDFPSALKKALNLSDFGLKEGKATSGKPLTAYRMRQVFATLDKDATKTKILGKRNEIFKKVTDNITELGARFEDIRERNFLSNDCQYFGILNTHVGGMIENIRDLYALVGDNKFNDHDLSDVKKLQTEFLTHLNVAWGNDVGLYHEAKNNGFIDIKVIIHNAPPLKRNSASENNAVVEGDKKRSISPGTKKESIKDTCRKDIMNNLQKLLDIFRILLPEDLQKEMPVKLHLCENYGEFPFKYDTDIEDENQGPSKPINQ